MKIVILFILLFSLGCVNISEYKKLETYCKNINGEPSKTLYEREIDHAIFIVCQTPKEKILLFIDKGKNEITTIKMTEKIDLTKLNIQRNDNNLFIKSE